MSALIIGGDRIGNYQDFLAARGFAPVHHWNGRKNHECHRIIPQHTELIVVFIDQVNHGLATKIRREANRRSLPIVFSNRSIARLDRELAAASIGAADAANVKNAIST
jgi:hypothetical protein